MSLNISVIITSQCGVFLQANASLKFVSNIVNYIRVIVSNTGNRASMLLPSLLLDLDSVFLYMNIIVYIFYKLTQIL